MQKDLFTPTDEELEEAYTPLGFDGVWSKLSQLLLIAHNISRKSLFLDRNWALTPQNFTCSICQRNKSKLIEYRNGSLYAVLHCDHDHICDVIFNKAVELNIYADLRLLIDQFSSYQPTIVCKSCNWIDSQIKRKFECIDKDFSFPLEIKKKLIQSIGKKRHRVDLDRAKRYWEKESKVYSKKIHDIDTHLLDQCEGQQTTRAHKKFNPKKNIYDRAYINFLRASKAYGWNIDFHSFIKRSISWQ